jgi:hypothetical protein
VADNARGVNATQFNMAGTGIGTFNDRSRDAVRGIGPFDSGQTLLQRQGFANGSFYDSKPTVPASKAQQKATCCCRPTRCGWAWRATWRTTSSSTATATW